MTMLPPFVKLKVKILNSSVMSQLATTDLLLLASTVFHCMAAAAVTCRMQNIVYMLYILIVFGQYSVCSSPLHGSLYIKVFTPFQMSHARMNTKKLLLKGTKTSLTEVRPLFVAY